MIVSIDNPLIDAALDVDENFLKQWGLKLDNGILADSKYQPLIDEVLRNPESHRTSGGACQNTLVMAQWLMQEEGKTAIVGSVGDDPNRFLLKEILTKCGVKCYYQVIPNSFTGCSTILVCNGNRSMVTSLGASGSMDCKTWDSPDVLKLFSKAKVIILANFFIRSSEKIALYIALECLQRKIPLALGLSSSAAIETDTWPTLKQIFKMATIVFGNKEEIISMAKKLDFIDNSCDEKIDLCKITKQLADYHFIQKRIVITTNGPDPVVACISGEEPFQRNQVDIPPSKIVDTIGAGDSFAGGFLAYYIKGYNLVKCIDAGNYCASCNIQERGCTVPNYSPNFK